MGSRSPGARARAETPGEDVSPTRVWANRLVRALDHDDTAAIVELLAEDAVVRIGAGPLLVGREATAQWLGEWLARYPRTMRQVVDVRDSGEARFLELEVSMETHDGVRVTWPEAISVRLRREAVTRLTMYGAPPLPVPTTPPGVTSSRPR